MCFIRCVLSLAEVGLDSNGRTPFPKEAPVRCAPDGWWLGFPFEACGHMLEGAH